MYVWTGAQEGQRLERAVNTIIFFIAINKSYSSHTEWYIITTVQISKLATWQKKLIYSAATSETQHEMSSLLLVVKSHLFPHFVHLNRERGISKGHWGERRRCGCQSRVGGHGIRELHNYRRGGGSQSRWADNPR